MKWAAVLMLHGLVGSRLAADFPKLALEPVSVDELLAPVAITHAGDGSGRLFVADQRGGIRIIDAGGTLLPSPFLDIGSKLVTERVGFDERGLLGLAFHPDYATPDAEGEGKFYVYYSAPSPDAPGDAENPVNHRSVVAEFRVTAGDPDVADPLSERELLTFNQPQFNHDGGQLAFGPDGLLYISTGDGGSSNDNSAGHTGGSSEQPSGVLGNSQDLTNLLGKILRINPQGADGPGGAYGIPGDNPLVGDGGGVREEIFAYGLRNPWRFSFDDGPGGTNRLFCADVGQGAVEEVNLIVNGGNYGWRNKEGTFDFDASAPGTGPFIDPIAQYAHPSTENGLPRIGISVTGGRVYRGTAFPELVGKYVFADWSTGFGTANGTILALDEHAPGEFLLVIPEVSGGNPIGRFIAAFGEGEDGELYVATKTTLAPSETDPGTGLPTGAIFRIVSGAEPGESVSLQVPATRDNSVYSENSTVSSGAGPRLYSGITPTGNERRALLAFDLSGELPAGSVVQSATLVMQVDNVATGAVASDMSLHRLTRDWGEAGSNAGIAGGSGAPAQAGDATWSHAEFGGEAWTTPGGDFVASASATTEVTGVGSYQWSGSGLVGDVQGFVDDPAGNAGWILRPAGSSLRTGKRFLSREAPTNGPRLEVQAVLPAPGNLDLWKAGFFEPGEVVDLEEDLDRDMLAGVVEYGAGLDPKSVNPVEDAYQFEVLDGDGRIAIRFRRDPRAIELTYRVEAGPEPGEWTTIAESLGGGATTGPGVVADDPIPGDLPFREVRVQDVAGLPGGERRFMRFVVMVSPP